MFRALHIAATGMGAQETQLEGISNNIANANTVGYKRERVDFQDLLYQTIRAPGAPTGATTVSPTGFQVGSGVRVVGTARVFEQGALQNTNNPLDVAIEGNGFFVVQQADGTPAYTRAGTFQKDGQGRIVTPEGLPLDPPITVPEGATDVSIAADGTVSAILGGEAAPVELGRITIATFVNPAGLRAIGHNLLIATEASGEPQIGEPGNDGRGTLLQGSLERANVEIVEEMIGLIAAQRAYEINTKVITTADEMLRAATQLR
ncbi:MAG: flagellar basal-body rod protein FlgG [Pseudomonadota bacterium]|nr:MAG: flagellar basal-body rod protein FlgG [Pseudomonadota bacterium]